MIPRTAQSGLPAPRRGFTLIELLIVLSILTILFSIGFAVYGVVLESAQAQATRATIRQLDSALQERLKAFQRINLKSQAQLFKRRYDAASPTNAPPQIPREIAEIIVRKDRYRAAFPQRLEDLWGFDGIGDTPDDAPLWTEWKRLTGLNAASVPPRTPPDDLESSELLYLALTSGGSFGAPVLTLDRLRADHVKDVNNNGLIELYDEWGSPLRFYNWPTRLIRPGGQTAAGPPIDLADITLANFRAATLPLIPSLPTMTSDVAYDFATFNGHPLNLDPDDPTGALIAAQNATGLGQGGFQLGGVPVRPLTEDFYATFDTYYVPLIVSAGPDRRIGLNEPSQEGPAPLRLAEPLDLADLDPVYDNITNQQP